MTTALAFTDFTMLRTDTTVVPHLFIGHKRLGPIGSPSSARDTPNLSAAIAGQGALQLQFLGPSGKEAQVYHTQGGAYASGYIRSLVNVQNATGIGVYHFGVYCYASQASLLASAGTCYLLGLSSFGNQYRARIVQSAAGLQDLLSASGGNPLAMSADAQWAVQTEFAMQFLWLQSGASLILEYWQGSTFATMTRILSYTDATPLSAPVGQGLWAVTPSANAINLLFDQTGYKAALGYG